MNFVPRIKAFVDEKSFTGLRIAVFLVVVPLAFLLLAPVILLLVLGLYGAAFVHGLRAIASIFFHQKAVKEAHMQPPHFLDATSSVTAPVESGSTPAS